MFSLSQLYSLISTWFAKIGDMAMLVWRLTYTWVETKSLVKKQMNKDIGLWPRKKKLYLASI